MLEELRSTSEKHPTFCVVNPPVGNVYFAAALREDGLALPDELLALYSAHDGFDLSCISDPPHIPVFSLLAGLGIDECDAQDGYPRRAACFQGGDEVVLSVYRDRRKQWWLVYEYEYVPVAKKTLDLEGLVSFGIQRMRGSFDQLNEGALSWEDYFGTRRDAASSPRPAT